jgi:GH43 family beta-xylosidase
MPILKVFTREPEGVEYPEEVAGSIHFAYRLEDGSYEALNRGYGVLFAEAIVRPDNCLAVKSLADPSIFPSPGGFGLTARRIDPGGAPDPAGEGKLLHWTSADLKRFVFHGLREPESIPGLPGAARAEIEVDDLLMEGLIEAWTPYPCGEPAEACDLGFPLAEGRADPVIFRWRGAWHFIATNDDNGNIGFRVRRASTVRGLFAPEAEEGLILDRDPARGFIQTFWAPEFHEIGGRLYLLFAVSGEAWGPQCWMMRLGEGGDLIDPESWEEPLRVQRMDGGPLGTEAITLDMTYIKAGGSSYLAWSQRRGINSPRDSGSMIYIARADDARPWRLAGEPVLLSRPLYGWENQSGTINNEGPYALYRDGMVRLSYSAGDARGYAYSIGFLSAREDADLLDPRSWEKAPSPALSSLSLSGQYGPGHNSFFEDDEGRTWIAYHAEKYRDRSSACVAVRRVFFDRSGRPRLDFAAAGEGDGRGPI